MKKVKETQPKKKTAYSITLNKEQLKKLEQWCHSNNWASFEVEHAVFAFKGENLKVVGYRSGKIVVQGRGTEHFVSFVLEGEITGVPRLGYDVVHHPEWFEPHAGLDESGKGDFFGPLVSCCVIADKEMVEKWLEAGIKDSKKIASNEQIFKFEEIIKQTQGVEFKVMYAGMRKYNELHGRFGANTNKLLAWFHAKALEEALKRRAVSWAMLDQFAKEPLVQNYFKNKPIEILMETKAESDPVVAAASILARAEYLRQMKKLSQLYGEELPKGSSDPKVKEVGKKIVEQMGEDALQDFAKVHFKTANEIIEQVKVAKRKAR